MEKVQGDPEKMYLNKPPSYSEFEDENYEFSETTIRHAFIRKVYSILMLQMLMAAAFIAWFLYDEKVRFYIQMNLWTLIVAFVVTFVVLIALMCCGEVRRTPPMNFILLGIFSLAESFILATVSAMYESETVLMAAGITVVVFLGLTLFSFQTKWDFTTAGGFLCVAIIVLMVFGIVVMFIPSKTMVLVYASIGALLFGFYMVYDTQLLMGGDHKYAISPEEYIFAVLALYLDIINFFMFILTILGVSRR